MLRLIILKQIALMGFLTLVALPHGANDFVLCKGEDGHLEIEVSRQGLCFSCLSPDDHDQPGSITGESHCGNCVDVAFSSTTALQFHSKYSGPDQATHAPSFLTQLRYRQNLTPQLFPQPPPITSLALVEIRTIRLII